MIKTVKLALFIWKIMFFPKTSAKNKFLFFSFLVLHNLESLMARFKLVKKYRIDSNTDFSTRNFRVLPKKGPINGIEIVNYEAFFNISGILNRYVAEIRNQLLLKSVEHRVTSFPSGKAKIMFHVFYRFAIPVSGVKNIALVTHIDSRAKLWQIRWLAEQKFSFICLSSQTENLIRATLSDFPIPTEVQVFSIDFPVFNKGATRKLQVGFFSNIYRDGRKRENLIFEAFRSLSPDEFSLSLMGTGLENLKLQLQNLGFEVKFCESFNSKFYNRELSQLDLLIYTGLDEGAVSILDALASGVPVLVTPVGFHLDFIGYEFLSYFSTVEELTQELSNNARRFALPRNLMRTRNFQIYTENLLECISKID